MTLKRQLLVVGALTFLIPLAGVQFVIELEKALRAQELSRLGHQAIRIASLLTTQAPSLTQAPAEWALLAETLHRQLILDGYGDDWPNRPDQDGTPLLYRAGPNLYWRAAQKDDSLWLIIAATGLPATSALPESAAGKPGLVLNWREPGNLLEKRTVEPRAPGRAVIRDSEGKVASDIEGAWQPRADGFTVELRLPQLQPGSRLGFRLESSQSPEEGPEPSASPSTMAPLPILLQDRPDLDEVLAPFVTHGQTLTLISSHGWELARASATQPGNEGDIDRFGPLELLQKIILQGLRLLLSANQKPGPTLEPRGALWQGLPLGQPLDKELSSEEERPDTAASSGKAAVAGSLPEDLIIDTVALTTYSSHEGSGLTVITPVGAGEASPLLISRRSMDALLSLSSATLGQVLSRSLLLMLILVLVLVGYATWLSWRISRLRNHVVAVVDSEGRMKEPFQASGAKDELGDLSRQFASLISQVRSYTDYLESFARKLSHELKTPLAVMRSSLDNLQHTDPTPQQTVYLDRASAGAARLSRILTAMSEATRLERSLTGTTPERFDLGAVLQAAAASYRALDSRVQYRGPDSGCPVLGSPDLLIQALDKLLENARDFTPGGGTILITLTPGERHHRLSVCNDGPLLPAAMVEHIFDSFVSLRDPGTGESHLGQGLVIVKLVADFHQAPVYAENREQDDGVCFHLNLPATASDPGR